jgi:hypothetical protein
MATIKYNEDEEGNKRIILKDGKVSCECCGCVAPSPALQGILLNWKTLQIDYTWPAFDFVDNRLPQRSGTFNITNGSCPDNLNCGESEYYSSVTDSNGSLVEYMMFASVYTTDEGFIYFEIMDSYIGGQIWMRCGVTGGYAKTSVSINGRVYPADWVSFEEEKATVTLTFS